MKSMGALEFEFQMARLASTFGKHVYPEERLSIIFDAVSDLPIQWLIKTIDRFVGSHRSAPLLPDFQLEADKFKRHQSTRPTDGSLNEDDPRFNSIFSDADVSMMIGMMKKKMNGKVPADEWKAFTEWVESTAKLSKQKPRET